MFREPQDHPSRSQKTHGETVLARYARAWTAESTLTERPPGKFGKTIPTLMLSAYTKVETSRQLFRHAVRLEVGYAPAVTLPKILLALEASS